VGGELHPVTASLRPPFDPTSARMAGPGSNDAAGDPGVRR
jgi:hypothetical protein